MSKNSLRLSVIEYFSRFFNYIFQVFYTSFYSPDKDLYPDEIFHTDSLATALVVFCVLVVVF